MSREDALVEEIRTLDTPEELRTASRYAGITFVSGRTARLDLSDPRASDWLSALEQMRDAGIVPYVEVDPATSVVTELLCPIRVVVGDLRPDDDAVDVELIISQTRHRLLRNNPDFDELLGILEQARSTGESVLVTESINEHSIIDVRLAPKDEPRVELAAPPEEIPTAGMQVTLAQANQMFNLVNNRTCCSANPTAPGIPFTFPDDGCWGRANEMCRLMIAAGVQPDKVWIYGNLHVLSANKPDCNVHWNWHVAPTLEVTSGSSTETYVIDPALFPQPVTRATWVSVQGDPNPTLAPTPADVFYRSDTGSLSYDPTYSQTNYVLATYRVELQLRSASSAGPPPYAQCQTRPVGVQWFGSIAGGATGRWFTFGWPASWHVLWTVVPTSICPGAPQLSWSVAVERASATHSTYWITVHNQTAHTVRFEGRYDVLRT